MIVSSVDTDENDCDLDAVFDCVDKVKIWIINEHEIYSEFNELVNLHFQALEETDTRCTPQISAVQAHYTDQEKNVFFLKFFINEISKVHEAFTGAF